MINPTSHRLWLVAVLVAVIVGGLLRLACLHTEFWLDEIWSWELAHSVSSGAGIFGLRHDNNHVLNSLWLHFWPATTSFAWLRLHSLLAGLASIVLAALIARRSGKADAVFAAFLVAGCSWTVFASAEARGYALAICFALAALESLSRYLDTGRWPSLVAFWIFSALGFLSHLTFVHAYIGFVVWSMRRFARQRQDLPQKPSAMYEISPILCCHGPVALFFVAYYFATIRGMEIGGGPPTAMADVLGRLLSLGLGGPASGFVCWVVVAIVVVLLVAGLWRISKTKGDVWTFFATAVVGAPALFLIRPPPILFERYFFVSFVFFLLLIAFVLGELWRSPLRPISVALLMAFLVGNAWHIHAFVESGRGEFEQALTWIVNHDASARILITGERDFRDKLYVDFYARRLGESGRCIYVSSAAPDGASWLIVHREPDEAFEPAEVKTMGSLTFTLERAYPSRGRMAWGWYVYRREK